MGKWPIAAAFVFSVLLVAVATLDASQKAQPVVGAEARNTAAYARITHLAAVLVAATNAETCANGYVITGDAGFLSPFDRALAVQAEELTLLEGFYAGDVERASMLRDVRDALAAQREHMTTAVATRRVMDAEAAKPLIASFRGRELTDSVRAAVKLILIDEQSALTRERAALASATSAGTRKMLVYAGLGLVVVSVAFGALLRERRRSAETEDVYATSLLPDFDGSNDL